MVPFLLGRARGLAVGMGSIPLPNGMHVKLGAAGGAFIVSLLAGHTGRIGKFRLFVPPAAKNLARELGLMLFLAGVGTTAGAQLVHILGQKGLVQPDMFYETLQEGDHLLLCSDGLWEMVPSDSRIVELIGSAANPSQACQALVKAAKEGGGDDNIGIVIVKVS